MPDAPAWSDDLLTDPHQQADKQRRVRDMFAAIAPSYDLNNRLHSFGQDQTWRWAAATLAEVKATDVVVDVACGTGDLTECFVCEISMKRGQDELSPMPPGQVIGIDFTYEMLPLARAKFSRLIQDWNDIYYGDDNAVCPDPDGLLYLNGDAQRLPLPDACCDVVSIAFGIRNVQNVDAALREFYRVLRPDGRAIVLEFSEPTNPLLRAFNRFYTRRVMPITATWISRDKSGAYRYLPKSVETFLSREQMAKHLADAGFVNLVQKPMTFGVCVAYRGEKPPVPSPGNPGEG